MIAPIACTIHQWSVGALDTGGSGGAAVIGLLQNGASAGLGCGLTVEGVPGAKGNCSQTAMNVSINAGDELSISVTQLFSDTVVYSVLMKCQ
jgi:hypothetical protein